MTHHAVSIVKNPFNVPGYFTPYQKSLQLKILHRGITTRSKLSLYKIITEEEANCTHCGEGIDDFYHGLVQCPGSRSSWSEYHVALRNRGIVVSLDVGHVLFGVETTHAQHLLLNLSILEIKRLLLHHQNSRRFLSNKEIDKIIEDIYQALKQRNIQYKRDVAVLDSQWGK